MAFVDVGRYDINLDSISHIQKEADGTATVYLVVAANPPTTNSNTQARLYVSVEEYQLLKAAMYPDKNEVPDRSPPKTPGYLGISSVPNA